jgi:hypothetical protein
MASQIPQSDQRLGAFRQYLKGDHVFNESNHLGYIEHYGVDNVNCASDLIAQYTSRQEYRYSEFSQGSDRRREIDQISKSYENYFFNIC